MLVESVSGITKFGWIRLTFLFDILEIENLGKGILYSLLN